MKSAQFLLTRMMNQTVTAGKLQKALIVWCRALSIALHDPRLPNVVRILIWLATLYLLCPLDIKPDFLPGGFIDDEVITPVLLLLAFFCIPKGVLADARRLANQATCGFVFIAISSTSVTACELSLTVPVAMTAPTQSFSLKCSLSNPNSKQTASSAEAGIEPVRNRDESDLPQALSGNAFQTNESKLAPRAPFLLRMHGNTHMGAPLRPMQMPTYDSRASRGQRLRLYQTGDDPDSSVAMLLFVRNFEPSFKRGGSFYAVSPLSCLDSTGAHLKP